MPRDVDVFQCQMCGHCCEGKGGIVASPSDLARLGEHLRLDRAEVVRLFCETSGGKCKIRCGDDGRCAFFRQGSGCAVHAAKPAVCRAWPFFRGNIQDSASLEMAKAFCPGIRRDVSHKDFARAGLDYLRRNGLVASDPTCEANALILD